MQAEAAAKIDQGIGKAAPQELPAEPQEKRTMTTFQPYMGKRRKPGTGCISQISPNCWEGRYSPMWPDGKKHSRNVYAKTREECEALLPGLIAEMKAEIRAIKQSGDLAPSRTESATRKSGSPPICASTRRSLANAA